MPLRVGMNWWHLFVQSAFAGATFQVLCTALSESTDEQVPSIKELVA